MRANSLQDAGHALCALQRGGGEVARRRCRIARKGRSKHQNHANATAVQSGSPIAKFAAKAGSVASPKADFIAIDYQRSKSSCQR